MESSIKTKLGEIEEINISDIKNLLAALAAKLENETDPTVPDHVKEITTGKIAGWDAKLAVSDIVNNLTTSDAAKALSAEQGVVLKTFIDDVLAILNSPDTSLDDLQEIVAYIKQNKQDLQNLGISNIAGLVDALAGKAATNDPRFHTHANKSILDAINQAKIDEWDSNSAEGKVNKTGDTMTGSLVFEDGTPVINIPEQLGSLWRLLGVLGADNAPWNAKLAVKTFASGGFDYFGFFDGSNNPFLIFNATGLAIGLPYDEKPTEKLDVGGKARIREMDNANKNFVRWDPVDGRLKERTVFQTKRDLGIGGVIAIAQNQRILQSSDRTLLASNQEKELNIILPDPSIVKDQEFRVVGNTVNFTGGIVVDIIGDRNISTHEGSITFASDGENFYKIS